MECRTRCRNEMRGEAGRGERERQEKSPSNWDKLEIKWMKMNRIIKSCQPEMRWIRIIYTNDWSIYNIWYINVAISKPCLAYSHSYSLQNEAEGIPAQLFLALALAFAFVCQDNWLDNGRLQLWTTKSEGDRPRPLQHPLSSASLG